MVRMVSMVASGAAAPTAWPRNGADASYPWSFSGRFWFRPALVRAPPEDALPDGVSAVAALGWTLGGVVTLEYDESPVGAYREYVTMGALVTKRGAVGQWGSRLCVSTPTAEAVCREVWGVPAQLADIELCEEGEALAVEQPPPPSTGAEYYDGDGADGAAPVPIRVSGWAATRSAAAGATPMGGLPVLWTPQIKALWAPLVPLPADGGAAAAALNLHNLRLSASGVRLHWCPQPSSDELGVPLGVGLSADGLLIEISEKEGEL